MDQPWSGGPPRALKSPSFLQKILYFKNNTMSDKHLPLTVWSNLRLESISLATHMVGPWSASGQPWSTHGRTMGGPWSKHGRTMVETWADHGRPMVTHFQFSMGRLWANSDHGLLVRCNSPNQHLCLATSCGFRTQSLFEGRDSNF